MSSESKEENKSDKNHVSTSSTCSKQNFDGNTTNPAKKTDNSVTTNLNMQQNQETCNTSIEKVPQFITLESCTCLDDTPFATKTELTADYQGSRISFVSDEFFGAASNLIKTTIDTEEKKPWEKDNEEDSVQNGWLVKRHEAKAYVTIKLGVPGVILGVNIDTTGHAQCAPITVAIDGHLKSSPGNWTKVLPEVLLRPDSPNYFQIRCSDVFTHVHITTTPGGGITRIRCFGDVDTPFFPNDKIINLASSKLGSQIIQKPRDILRRDLPNLILSRSDSSHDGWISPRNNSRSYRSEYTVIKLAQEGTIDRIVLDTKHFIGNAPKFVIVEGCSLVDQAANQHTLRHAYWVNLLNQSGEQSQNIYSNMSQVLACTYQGPITHIRVRPVPDGGLQQILVKGRVFLRDENNIPMLQTDTPITSKKRKSKHDHKDNKLKKPTRQSERLKARSTQSNAY